MPFCPRSGRCSGYNMETWMKICGGALLCVVAITVLRQLGRDGALPLQWLGILLLGGAGLALMQPIIAFAGELAAVNGVEETSSLLLRALGVALVCQLCADLCRQSGEGSIAGGVEMAGRLQILLLALPKLQQLLQAARELLRMAG